MDLPTYTNIWRIEKRLYKLYDLRLPMPLPLVQIGVFIGVFAPWIVLLQLIGIPFGGGWILPLYLVPPAVLTWLATRPVIEGKRLTELLLSQTRYLAEPRTWCRLTPIREPAEVVVVARVWRRAGAPAPVAAAERAAVRSKRKARKVHRGRHAAPRLPMADPTAGVAPPRIPARPATQPPPRVQVRTDDTGTLTPPSFGGPSSVPPIPVPQPTAFRQPDPGPEPPPTVPKLDMPPAMLPPPEQAPTGTGKRGLVSGRLGPGGGDNWREISQTDAQQLADREQTAPAPADQAERTAEDAELTSPAGPKAAEASPAASNEQATSHAALEMSGRTPDATQAAPAAAEREAVREAPEVAERTAEDAEFASADEGSKAAEVGPAASDEQVASPSAAAEAAGVGPATFDERPASPAGMSGRTPGAAEAAPASAEQTASTAAFEMSGRTTEAAEAAPAAGRSASQEAPEIAERTAEDAELASSDGVEDSEVAAAEAAAPTPSAEDSEVAGVGPAAADERGASGETTERAAESASAGERARDGGVAAGAQAEAEGARGEQRSVPRPWSKELSRAPREARTDALVWPPPPHRRGAAPAERDRGAAQQSKPPRPPAPPPRPAQDPAATSRKPVWGRSSGPWRVSAPGIPPRPQGTPIKPPPPRVVPDAEPPPAPPREGRSSPASPVRPEPRQRTHHPPSPDERAMPPSAPAITPPDPDHEGMAAGGLRRLIKAMGGGNTEVDSEYLERLQRPFYGARHIVVLGCTGGAGQTVTALMMGHTFAQQCGEPIVAIDVNPGPGALARRTRSQTPETLTGLIARADQVTSLTAVRRYTSRAKSGLDVIAAGKNPVQALDDRDYALAFRTLDHFYSVTMLDAAAAIVARVLPYADQLVLVAPASSDAARAVQMTFEWLDGHGYDELRSRAVTVVNGVSRRSMSDVQHAESVARGRCRALVRIPWDDHLSLDRSPRNELKSLRAPTRRAYLALAGVVAGGFTVVPERYQEREATR